MSSSFCIAVMWLRTGWFVISLNLNFLTFKKYLPHRMLWNWWNHCVKASGPVKCCKNVRYLLWCSWLLRNKNLHSVSWSYAHMRVWRTRAHTHTHTLRCVSGYFSSGLTIYNAYWVSVKVKFMPMIIISWRIAPFYTIRIGILTGKSCCE